MNDMNEPHKAHQPHQPREADDEADEMYEALATILTSRFRVRPELISRETTLRALGLDSLFLVELTFVLEDRTGLSVAFDDLVQASTLGDIVRLMEESDSAAV